MEIIKTQNLSFTYPMETEAALDNINLSVDEGEFVTICGKSGCGKTTLLRLLKPELAPHGKRSGDIYFAGGEIGFIMQSPDEQIVTDKVWHELAFGLENMGLDNDTIRRRVAEMSSFFGIEGWFYKKTADLSGGEKQLLNLASVMVMQPSVLLLDEPTSQLDPVWAESFLEMLKRINREFGTTVVISEQRLNTVFALSDRAAVMENGRIIAYDTPQKVGVTIKDNDMNMAMPAPVQLFNLLGDIGGCPVTIGEGRRWLKEFIKKHPINISQSETGTQKTGAIIDVKNVWFRYQKNEPDIIKGLSLKINKSEIFTIIGGNGTGKSTLLSLITGLNKPYRGKVKTDRRMCAVPQRSELLFLKNTVLECLLDFGTDINEVVGLCHLEKLLHRHPYDLSGGEKQRLALAMALMKNTDIIILDEPTKGMDAHFKHKFGNILLDLKTKGKTVVTVSHDIEFTAEFSDRCAYMFDGVVVATGTPRKMFCENTFYTTEANKMTRGIIADVILTKDISGGRIND